MRLQRLLFGSALVALLAGCVVPPAAGSGSAGAPPAAAPPPAVVADPDPAVAPGAAPAAGGPSTSVGARAAELGREVDQLELGAGLCSVTQADIKTQRAQLANAYYSGVGQIDARLEAGTTAGNPDLIAAWKSARSALDSLDHEAARLTDLVTSCTDDTARATYLTQSIRAALNLRGAVDADHAQLIRQSGQVAQIASNLDLTLGLMLDDLNRQNEMLLVEHRNLTTLAHAIDVGQLLGGNLGLRATALPTRLQPLPAKPRRAAFAHPAAPTVAATAATPGVPAAVATAPLAATDGTAPGTPGPATAGPHARGRHHSGRGDVLVAHYHHHRPLIVIPLGDDGGYEHALYGAVSAVLAKQPGARFDVEAAVQRSPDRARAVLAANAAQHVADAVARSLAAFGLPQGRVTTLPPVAAGSRAGIRVYAQ